MRYIQYLMNLLSQQCKSLVVASPSILLVSVSVFYSYPKAIPLNFLGDNGAINMNCI